MAGGYRDLCFERLRDVSMFDVPMFEVTCKRCGFKWELDEFDEVRLLAEQTPGALVLPQKTGGPRKVESGRAVRRSEVSRGVE